jgi:hypothetical protein
MPGVEEKVTLEARLLAAQLAALLLPATQVKPSQVPE